MFSSLKAKQALARTTPHPSDPAVRLTDSSDDLVAIHHRDVRAVIWQRKPDQEIAAALKEMDVGTLKIWGHKDMLTSPSVVSSGFFNAIYGQKDSRIPAALDNDLPVLAEAFRKAQGWLFHRHKENPLMCWLQKEACEPSAHIRAQGFHPFGNTIRAHIDRYPLREVVTYCLDDRMGTVWYPGDFTEEQVEAINDELQNAKSVEELEGVMQKHHAQHVKPGDVVVMKGYDHSSSKDRKVLVHSSPVPKQNVLRMTRVYP